MFWTELHKPQLNLKEANQWYDVGIIKGSSCLVSHFYLSSDGLQGNGDVSLNFLSVLLYEFQENDTINLYVQ
jgi:hypothetical protein